MGIFLIHILKSSVCLALFYLCYRMLLSKETFHRFNRLTLLGIMILSFLLPFIEITLPKASEMSQPFLLLEEAMETVEVKRLDVLTETPKHFPWSALAFVVYASGILFFLLRHAWSMGRMLCLIRTCWKEKRGRNHPVCPSGKDRSFQLDEEDSHFRRRLGKTRRSHSGTRTGTHPQRPFMGLASGTSVCLPAMVQSCGVAPEERIADHPRVRSR